MHLSPFRPVMRLTTFTDYGLRVLIYIAASPAQQATIAEIATAFRISTNHLMKVVHLLGRSDLLANRRGKGGGLFLARSAASINVGEVVRLLEGRAMPAECFDSGRAACRIAPACRLRGILGEAADAFQGVLDQHTLADLVKNHEDLGRLLFLESGRGTLPPDRPVGRSIVGRAR